MDLSLSLEENPLKAERMILRSPLLISMAHIPPPLQSELSSMLGSVALLAFELWPVDWLPWWICGPAEELVGERYQADG